MFAMAHRARSEKPWNLIAWTKKRSLAERSIKMTRDQERTLGNTTQVKIFDERQWEKMRDAQREAIEREPAPPRAPRAAGRSAPRRTVGVRGRAKKTPEAEKKPEPKAKERKEDMSNAVAKPEAELEFPPEPFPVNMQGHTLNDSEKTMAIGVSLYCFKPGTNAFPSIQLAERDGLDIRAASNAKFIYFWGRGRLFAINLEEVITSARFHLTGKSEKKAPKAAPTVAPATVAPVAEPAPAPAVPTRRKATCSVCKEMDIDLFNGTDLDAISKNGWVITAGVATCPQCFAKSK